MKNTLKNYGEGLKSLNYKEYQQDGNFIYAREEDGYYKVIVAVTNCCESKVIFQRNIDSIKRKIESLSYIFHKELPKKFMFLLFSMEKHDMAKVKCKNVIWSASDGNYKAGLIEKDFRDESRLIGNVSKFECLEKKDYDHGIYVNYGFAICTFILVFINCLIWYKGISSDKYALNGNTVFETKKYYTIFTYAFFHSGLLHLIGNMVVLYYFGTDLEHKIGKIRYLLLTVFSIFVTGYSYAIYCSFNSEGYNVTVGYSGVIFSILGALLIYNFKYGFSNASVISLILVNVVVGLYSSDVNSVIHYIGLASGAYIMIMFIGISLIQRFNIRKKVSLFKLNR